VAGFQSYLDSYPTGRHSDAAFGGIVALSRGLPLKDEAAVRQGRVAGRAPASTPFGGETVGAGPRERGALRLPGLY
jgi:hypothetical protein